MIPKLQAMTWEKKSITESAISILLNLRIKRKNMIIRADPDAPAMDKKAKGRTAVCHMEIAALLLRMKAVTI
jgi:hypothetical protein